MSYSNRELVLFFLSHRLSKKNYSTSLLRPQGAHEGTGENTVNSAASNGIVLSSREETSQPTRGQVEAVKSALLESSDEFELLFTQAFSDLSSQLDITPDTAYHSFKSVMDEVFKDGVNWGRVVGLFAFGGVLCLECVEKDMSELVPRIADWMTMYLDENISQWLESQGGWDCFAEVFGNGAASGSRRSQEAVRKWLLVGVALLTGVLIGVSLAKRQ